MTDQQANTAATPPALTQLRMVWPAHLLSYPPPVEVPAGYLLRQYREEEEAEYIELMAKAGFTGWTHDNMVNLLRKVLPDGFFIIEHIDSGSLVATTVATHNPIEGLPFSGELGWVAGDPEHKRKGLGMAVCAATIQRFLQAGYRNIYLLTDDQRLPALKIYLRLGFEPWFHCDGITERWRAVGEALKMIIPGLE